MNDNVINFSTKKLGKAPPRFLKGLPALNHYTGALPAAPDSVTNSVKATNYGEMLNDKLSCCTISAGGHAGQIWTSLASAQYNVTDGDIEFAYEHACGYDPGNPSTDQGGIESQVLTYWLKNPLGGKISLDAFCSVTPKDIAAVKDSIWLLGGCYIGLALPLSAQHQTVWDVDPAGSQSWFDRWFAGSSVARSYGGGDPTAGSWGGHAVYVVDYDSRGLTCLTWGQKQRMTWNFWLAYCDEAWGLLSKTWIKSTGLAPSGFDYEKLEGAVRNSLAA